MDKQYGKLSEDTPDELTFEYMREYLEILKSKTRNDLAIDKHVLTRSLRKLGEMINRYKRNPIINMDFYPEHNDHFVCGIILLLSRRQIVFDECLTNEVIEIVRNMLLCRKKKTD